MVRRLQVCGLVLVTVLLGKSIPAQAAEVKGEKEALLGFDLGELAKALCQFTTLRTQYGEKDGVAHFDAWLKTQGRTHQQYDAAYGAWWQRFKADSTGQLEARFHALNGQCANDANFGDVPSHAKEIREGITLEQYAKVSVALSRQTGADPNKVLRQNGIDSQARWKRVNDAWTKAMHDDTSLALVQQYAALYQKYAGPDFEKEQQDKTAEILAAHNREAPPPPSPHTGPPSLADLQSKLTAASPAERWSAEIWSATSASRTPPSRRPSNARSGAIRIA